MNKEEVPPPVEGGGQYIGKKADISDASAELQHEAYELIIDVCMKQLAEHYSDAHADDAMNAVFRQISALIRAQMTPRHLAPNTLEPHALALRLLELLDFAYNGLLPDGTPDPDIQSDS